MNEREHSLACERASDLIAFIYNEVDEHEARDFQVHLRECESCRAEAASFGVVREAITDWRDEVLAGFVSTSVPAKTHRKSALAALRQFFDLSPLWLKGASAFAVVIFCVLAGLVFFKGNDQKVSAIKVSNPEAVYTKHDVDQMVREALAKQQDSNKTAAPTPSEKEQIVKYYPKPKSSRPSNETAKSRRPLSRSERQQLAADLRLLSTGGDESIQLLGDRINQ